MGGSYPPGYTGIMRTQEVYDEKPMNKVGEKQIPGTFLLSRVLHAKALSCFKSLTKALNRWSEMDSESYSALLCLLKAMLATSQESSQRMCMVRHIARPLSCQQMARLCVASTSLSPISITLRLPLNSSSTTSLATSQSPRLSVSVANRTDSRE